MARKKTKSVRKTLRAGKTRISGQLTKSSRGRRRTASVRVRTGRKKLSVRATAEKNRRRTKAKTAKSQPRQKTASVRAKAGGKTISFRVSGGKSNGSRSRPRQENAGFHLSQKTVERNAAQLIDLAANILKTGVQLGVAVGTQGGAKGKQYIKKQADSMVTAATRRLNDVVRKGSRLAHKGIKKI